MSRRTGFMVGALVVLALGWLASYLLGRAESYETVINHGAAPEVKANPYSAAEAFLRAQRVKVETADSLAKLNQLPSIGHTLLLLADREKVTPQQTQRLLDWAAKGGHLVFVAERLWDKKKNKSGDLLLDSLGIQQLESDKLDPTETTKAEADKQTTPLDDDTTQAASEPEQEPSSQLEQLSQGEPEPAAEAVTPDEEKDAYPKLTKLYLENEDAPAYISFDTDFHLYDAKNIATAWANSGQSTHMLQLFHGDGLITVLTDSWVWQNDKIAKYDNAWLLWYLTQDTDVTLLFRADRDGLLSLLYRYFPQALLALALLIGLTLWRVGMRQGPLLLPASLSRRQLQEHIRASADFSLRRSGQQPLLQGLQLDIQRRARKRHPGFERLPVADQWLVLSRLTRLTTSAVGKAMRPVPLQRLTASEFTRQVAHLQTLRNAL
ncbi:DUF4350 domain-containing protein [Pseudomonas sp. EL_65y_Pfl2_R95]|uniref:DUF4350 domain-containing protein n=1 Tax=Pseudomonas sp. EL_65y_Pfl2_R95 TaxID=3088698 RepID=UPI0030D9BF88